MNPPAAWVGILLVLAALGVLVVGLRCFQLWSKPHPELVRKLLHVGMGLAAVSFPWLFDRSWPILMLGALSLGGMLAMRYVKSVRGSVGSVVGGVARNSFGEVYFPIAVAILFHLYLLQEGLPLAVRVVLYCVPVLLLALADAAAALVGVYYGNLHYTTTDGFKSMEGSFAFFVCAFFCVHLPLLLATDVGRGQTLLIALLLAWLAMLFEAVAWAGLDNLVLPLVSYLLLKAYLKLPVEELMIRLAVTGGLMAFVLLYRNFTSLQGSALLGASLIGYICWAVGGWHWLLAPLLVFAGYKVLTSGKGVNNQRPHNVHAVVWVSLGGLTWLFLATVMDRPDFYYLFMLAFAAQMAIIAVARLGFRFTGLSGPSLVCLCTLEGWLLLFVPFLLVERFSQRTLFLTLGALPAIALAAAGFYLTQPQVRDCPVDTPRWLRQAFHGGLGSALGLLPLCWY
jgi:phytol kinase